MWIIYPPEEDPIVFCDGRLMRRSEMRALVKADMERWAALDLQAYQRQQELKGQREAAERLQKKTEWWDQWRREFVRWEQKNQEARAEAGAEERARHRRQRDEAMVRDLLERKKFYAYEARLGQFEVIQRRLDRLTDHEYIQWMFACAEHGFVCPG